MSDTEVKFIVWGGITLVAVIAAFFCYRWISGVARFENRKKEIAVGMIVCVLAVSSFMFLPVLFSRIDLHQSGTDLFDQIQFAEIDAEDNAQFAEMNAENNVSKIELPPFVRPFSHVLALIPYKYIRVFTILIPAVASLLVILFTVLIILKIREPKKKEGENYKRKHLFEYKSEILTKLNKDSQR